MISALASVQAKRVTKKSEKERDNKSVIEQRIAKQKSSFQSALEDAINYLNTQKNQYSLPPNWLVCQSCN